MSPRIAPVRLGCCREAARCRLCPPPPPWPTADQVQQRIDVVELEGDATVGFFGGLPPSDDLLAAAGERAIQVRVRPDLLTRAEAARLIAAGVIAIELDVLTLDDRVLADLGRHHERARVLEMSRALRQQGIEVGWVLAPGLPGTSHHTFLRDVEAAVAAGVDTVRLHPVVVWQGSGLEQDHMEGRYEPLTLAQAVTSCRAALQLLEDGGVRVIRIGQQSGPDGLGRALAGPAHPALRQLVEARRALETLSQQVRAVPQGSVLTIVCAPPDETRVRGPRNQHVRALRAQRALAGVRIEPDPTQERGSYALRWSTGE